MSAEVLDFLTDDLRLLVREGDRYHFAGLRPIRPRA